MESKGTGGGFEHVLLLPLIRELIQFDELFFCSDGYWNHQLEKVLQDHRKQTGNQSYFFFFKGGSGRKPPVHLHCCPCRYVFLNIYTSVGISLYIHVFSLHFKQYM